MNLSGVILAGGQSRRMGRDKAWIELEGQSLIARSISVLHELGIADIFISGRPGVDYSSFGHPVLLDLEPGRGPVGGIERGLRAARSKRLLVLAVDLPRMTSAFLRKLHRHCEASEAGIVPALNGRSEPLAAIYPKACHGIASACLDAARWSARAFVDACLRQNAVHPYPVEPPDAPCFDNWNTPDDTRPLPSHPERQFLLDTHQFAIHQQGPRSQTSSASTGRARRSVASR